MTASPHKRLHLVGFLLIAAFGIYGATGIKGSITPYVSIAEARSTTDRVQVKGTLDKSSMHTDSLGRLIFRLTDFKTKQGFTVVYSGQHPANMQMARDVVAMGTWNPGLQVDGVTGVFDSDQMNIKCPDKYQTSQGAPPAT